jgi:iron complex transport system substrate-binding protein
VNQRRIVSFLPAATEMIFALGLDDELVGVSHECDFPPEAKAKLSLIKPALALDKMSPREIDEAVSARLRSGQSLYSVDERLLHDLAPDLIVTQDLCQVCAPSGNEASLVLIPCRTNRKLSISRRILSLEFSTISASWEESLAASNRPKASSRIAAAVWKTLPRARASSTTVRASSAANGLTRSIAAAIGCPK